MRLTSRPSTPPARARRGFTLVELLVVVVIIGILAGMAMSNFRNTTGAAKEATLRSDVHQGIVALEAYYVRNSNTYVGATEANTNAVKTGSNTIAFSNLSSTGATITVTNPEGTQSCSQTIGSSPVKMACTAAP